MKFLCNIRNHELCIRSPFRDIEDRKRKTVKIIFFSKNFFEKTHENDFFENVYGQKCSLISSANFSEIMVSISIPGFEKFASQVGRCHEIYEKKRHHMGTSHNSSLKNTPSVGHIYDLQCGYGPVESRCETIVT